MLENKFLDLFFNIRGSLPSPRNVVIVAMDEDSYGNLGISPNQPWPRILHAKLIRRLKELGARRAVFDVLFLGSGSDAKADIELARAITSIPTVLGADYGTIEEHLY
ncbi:MAG: CHASE2 domain-containing protein, partial [Chlamydiota bacterium]|nr:CHASE2 domain-containing protein [Chlamydiota bacterium]